MSTLVTILRPTVQLGMNSWLDFGLWRCRRVGSPTTVAEGYRRWPEANSALSRRKQGFESPRERQRNQRLIVRSPVGVQQLSNKRLRTGMDDRVQTPPRFIGDSTWMSRTGSRPNRLGSVSSPV